MIVGRTMWTQSTSVPDRRTDRRTDRITITDTVQTASHGKNRPTFAKVLYTVSEKKSLRFPRHNFIKYYPIFEILLLLQDSVATRLMCIWWDIY